MLTIFSLTSILCSSMYSRACTLQDVSLSDGVLLQFYAGPSPLQSFYRVSYEYGRVEIEEIISNEKGGCISKSQQCTSGEQDQVTVLAISLN